MTPDAAGRVEHSIRYAGWRVALAAAGCVFVSFASLLVFTFSVFLKPLTAEFGWSREAASLAFAISAMTVALCSPPIGMLLDRYPARRIILPCITVFGCAFASLSLLTPHLWHLYAVFFILGVVGNGTAQLASSRAVTTWFQERRGGALAVLMVGSSIGVTIWPLLTQALIDRVGWRATTATLGAIVLALGWPLALRIRERPGSFRTKNQPAFEPAIAGASVSEGLRSRVFWVIVAVLFFGSFSQNGAITHLSAMLTDRGVPTGDAALAVSAMGVTAFVGRLLTGWLLDRFFAPGVAIALLLLGSLGALILSIANTMPLGVVGASLIGFGMGGEADVTPWLLAKYFGLRSFSTLYALTWTAYAIAGAVGPVIMGKAFDLTGSYQTLLMGLAAVSAASSSLMLLIPPPPNLKPEAAACA